MAEPVPGISAVPDESNARYFHVVVAGSYLTLIISIHCSQALPIFCKTEFPQGGLLILPYLVYHT